MILEIHKEHMARSIDITKLPLKQYGNKAYINWEMAVGSKIPFIYDNVTGYLTVREHQKGNYIVIGYLGRTKRLRTNQLFRLQFRDLIDPDKKLLQRKNIKTQEAFLNETQKLYQNEYEVLSAYCGNKKPILIRHNCATCNYHTFSPTPNNFLRGSGCPLCNGSPSFPEVCILLVVSQFFPKAKREKIGRRECDIVFYVKGKRIGLQYDGSFYHKSSQKDNEFNNIFLEDETSYLIRIREAGCPKLVPHYRLYQVKANNIYSKINLNKTISDIFQVINALLGEEYQPQLTDKIMKKASQQSKRSYHYKLLMDQYITYLCENQATPTGKSANNLQGRITTAIREQRFDNGQMAEIFETKKRLGLYVEERNPNFIYQDMVNFSSQSGILPRQQAGDKEETFLYREIKRCIRNNLFSEQQMQEYKWLCERTSNYPMSADRLYSIYVQFVQCNQRLPSIVNGPDEKSLLSKVNHRLARQSFLPEQQLEIERIRLRFSCKNIKNRIIEEYRSFLAVNDRLPFYKAEGLEGKLEMDMLRYLREHRFTIEECHEILKMRGKYQTLKRRFREHVLYLEEGKAEFAQK